VKTFEVTHEKHTLDGSILADQIDLLIKKTQDEPQKFKDHLIDFYFHGVCEGIAMTGQRVKSITERDKTD
jgi:hypothetical protein